MNTINFCLPLINFMCLSVGGRYIGRSGAFWTTLYFYSLIIFTTCLQINQVVMRGEPFLVELGSWFTIGDIEVCWELIWDPLSVLILFVVTSISFCVHIYSFKYIQRDPHLIRFIAYLSLFTFFIVWLILSGNLVQFFIGWEGVGICSYLLINFWSTRVQANKAAIKAILLNRIGDIGVLLAISLLLVYYRTTDFITLLTLICVEISAEYSTSSLGYNEYLFVNESFFRKIGYNYEITKIDTIALLLFIGVIGKSAQFGLHIWLPSAIEGPTPVSALIHAATIVTAGVYLILRISFIFELSSLVRFLLIIMGLVTALLSAFSACNSYDIKRIIAYSTCSQLGYIVIACGLSQYLISFFHLFNHAFFKALLFLTAGVIIHLYAGEQDIRRLYIGRSAPFLLILFIIASISLIGVPYLSGFYSKEFILGTISGVSIELFWLLQISALLTTFYSCRLLYFLFFRTGIIWTVTRYRLLAQSKWFVGPLSILAVCSIIFGYFSKEIFLTPVGGSLFWPFIIGQINLYNIDTLFRNLQVSYFYIYPGFGYYIKNFAEYLSVTYQWDIGVVDKHLRACEVLKILLNDQPCPLPDKSCPLPDKSCPLPDNSCPLPDKSCPLPDNSCPLPDKSCPLPDNSCPLPDKSCPLPDNSCPLPDKSCPLPDKSCPLPDNSCPLPDKSCPLPPAVESQGLIAKEFIARILPSNPHSEPKIDSWVTNQWVNLQRHWLYIRRGVGAFPFTGWYFFSFSEAIWNFCADLERVIVHELDCYEFELKYFNRLERLEYLFLLHVFIFERGFDLPDFIKLWTTELLDSTDFPEAPEHDTLAWILPRREWFALFDILTFQYLLFLEDSTLLFVPLEILGTLKVIPPHIPIFANHGVLALLSAFVPYFCQFRNYDFGLITAFLNANLLLPYIGFTDILNLTGDVNNISIAFLEFCCLPYPLKLIELIYRTFTDLEFVKEYSQLWLQNEFFQKNEILIVNCWTYNSNSSQFSSWWYQGSLTNIEFLKKWSKIAPFLNVCLSFFVISAYYSKYERLKKNNFGLWIIGYFIKSTNSYTLWFQRVWKSYHYIGRIFVNNFYSSDVWGRISNKLHQLLYIFIYKYLDKGLLEKFGPLGFHHWLISCNKWVYKYIPSNVNNLFIYIYVGIILFLLLLLLV